VKIGLRDPLATFNFVELLEFPLGRRQLGLEIIAAGFEILQAAVVFRAGGGVGEQRHLLRAAAVRGGVHGLGEPQQPVIVLLQDRIDLVIVAAGAVHRQAEKDLAGGGDDVIQPVIACLFAIGRLVVPDAKAVVGGGDDAVIAAVRQLVAGELFANEAIVR